MNGSKTTFTGREAVLEAMKTPPPGGFFEWDGVDEDERPASPEELRAGIERYRRSRGRPRGSNKEQVAIRFDKDVLDGLRATGKGWQTRVNDTMREWLKEQTA
ncbi:hypothetical protein FACS189475_06350 [Betaproteobacteria bacterium]|nr:hypothetical protein FACS189475_06350 [Betaproteobacteria bacterium]